MYLPCWLPGNTFLTPSSCCLLSSYSTESREKVSVLSSCNLKGNYLSTQQLLGCPVHGNLLVRNNSNIPGRCGVVQIYWSITYFICGMAYEKPTPRFVLTLSTVPFFSRRSNEVQDHLDKGVKIQTWNFVVNVEKSPVFVFYHFKGFYHTNSIHYNLEVLSCFATVGQIRKHNSLYWLQ